jgi:hypothetical protein
MLSFYKRRGGPRHRARGTLLSEGAAPNDLWCAQDAMLSGSTLPRNIAHRDGRDTHDYNSAGIGRGVGAAHDPAVARTVFRFSTVKKFNRWRCFSVVCIFQRGFPSGDWACDASHSLGSI